MAVAENWICTRSDVVEFSYIWTISNSCLHRQVMVDVVKSPNFSADKDKSKWCMELDPNCGNYICRDWLSLFLVLVSTDKLEVTAKCAFSILDAKREKRCTQAFKAARRVVQGGSIGFEKFIERSDLYNYLLVEGKLTILCEVSAVVDPVNITGQDNRIRFEVPEGTFSEDLGNLFANGRFSDVTLAVGGREFQAHKVILVARSPVFAAMFEHEMEERKQNRVTITDVDHEVLEEMLRFMYTDKAPNLAEMVEGLLAAADKYALEKLKAMCEVALCLKLSAETAAETLILADLHSAGHLKAQAIKFIIAHPTDVIETDGWKNMIAKHPHLIAEAFRAIVTQ